MYVNVSVMEQYRHRLHKTKIKTTDRFKSAIIHVNTKNCNCSLHVQYLPANVIIHQQSCILNVNPFIPTFFSDCGKNEYESVPRHTDLTHHFNFFDIRALWRSVLSARVPECQKLKTVG